MNVLCEEVRGNELETKVIRRDAIGRWVRRQCQVYERFTLGTEGPSKRRRIKAERLYKSRSTEDLYLRLVAREGHYSIEKRKKVGSHATSRERINGLSDKANNPCPPKSCTDIGALVRQRETFFSRGRN